MHNVTSPNNSDESVEQEIQRKGKTAPRITPDDIEANIASEAYFTADKATVAAGESYHDAQTLLTICVLVLANGFTVTGTSACASPENFEADIGRKVARANAVQQIWPLMGYELKQRLYSGEQYLLPHCNKDLQPWQQRVVIELGELNVKRKGLDAFLAGDSFDKLGDDDTQRLFAQAEAMTAYATALQARIDAF